MNLRSLAFPVLISASFATACGGSSSGGGFTSAGGTTGTGMNVPLDDVPAMYAAALCDAYLDCAGPLLEVFQPGEDCTALNTARIDDSFGPVQDAIDADRIVYDGTHIEACVNDIRGRSCAQLLERETPECEAALRGTVALGDDCTLNEECVGSAFCKVEAACPGVCTALLGAGEDCTESNQCASGLECGDDQICVEPAGPGDVCQGGEADCAPGYLCAGANEDNNTSGNCRTFDEVFTVGSGQPCSFFDGELCQTNLVCEIQSIDAMTGITAICAAKKGAGQPCRVAIPDQCPNDQYCAVVPNTLEGTCTARPAAGQPCAPSALDDNALTICIQGTQCDDGTCRARARLGQSCTVDAVCLSEHCLNGTCVNATTCE
ncbi:MAG TPA: hypothetical protein VHO25_11660 [Polyangiaceae bacterium]|nr:hypothetical protein [Polyangiaceae bacterium]